LRGEEARRHHEEKGTYSERRKESFLIQKKREGRKTTEKKSLFKLAYENVQQEYDQMGQIRVLNHGGRGGEKIGGDGVWAFGGEPDYQGAIR